MYLKADMEKNTFLYTIKDLAKINLPKREKAYIAKYNATKVPSNGLINQKPQFIAKHICKKFTKNDRLRQ